MGSLTPGATYIYESPDGGETVYARKEGSTERILALIRATDWWKSYFITRDSSIAINTAADVPAMDINKIIGRANDFTDLCVYYSLYDYILPKIADFSNEMNAERQKIAYYQQKFNSLFGELIAAGDWYDFDGDDTIESSEKNPGIVNLRRVR